MAFPDIEEIISQYKQAKSERSPVEQQWRLNAAYCLPREYAEWSSDGQPLASNRLAQATRYAYDGTGPKSVKRYGSVINRILTPEGQKYHILQATNRDLRKIYSVRKWFDELNDTLHTRRHAAAAMFKQAQGEVYLQLGVYGTGCKSLMWSAATHYYPQGGFTYRSWPIRDIFIVCDDEGRVIMWFRRFWLTPRQFKRKWPNYEAPKSIKDADQGESRDNKYTEFFHVVGLRADYEAGALGVQRHPWYGCYVAVNDKMYIGPEQGYITPPYMTPRTDTSSTSAYGYAPAEYAFPALGTANAMKKTMIKQGHKAVEPALLVNDDGVLSGRIDTRPNALIYGGITKTGQKLVAPMDEGSKFEVAQELLNDERNDIADNFLSMLFRLLEEKPDMTAAAVYETVAKEASLVAPLMGRLQAEDMQPMIEREMALLAEHGQLAPMPPELAEARGEYNIEYTSPMAKAMYAEEVSGFMRVNELATATAQATGDPSKLDYFDYDVAYPEIAERMSVPSRWMATPEQIAAKRQQRQEQFETEQAVKAAPAMASVAASAMKTKQGKNAGSQN